MELYILYICFLANMEIPNNTVLSHPQLHARILWLQCCPLDIVQENKKKRPNATTMRRNLKYSKSGTKGNATSTKKEKKNASTNGLRKLKRKNPKVITNLYVKYIIYYIYVIYVKYVSNFKYHAFRNVERKKISMISTRSTHMLKKQNSIELNGTMHRLIANQSRDLLVHCRNFRKSGNILRIR